MSLLGRPPFPRLHGGGSYTCVVRVSGLRRSADGSAGVLSADELRAKSEAYEAQLAEYLRDASPEVTIAIYTDSNT